MAAAAAILFAGQTLLAPVATAQNLPNLGGSEREDLSPLMERKLGEQVMRDIRRDRDYLNDAPTLEYLNDFGNSTWGVFRSDGTPKTSFDRLRAIFAR